MKGIVILAAMTMASAAASASSPGPEAVQASLDRNGPDKTVERLESADRWEAVLDNIGKGGRDRVALAPRLAPGTDGASAEGLGIALAHALPANPSAVLRVAEDGVHGIIGIARVCGTPVIETSRAYNATYDRRAIRAVSAVSAGDLKAKRDACLARLTS